MAGDPIQVTYTDLANLKTQLLNLSAAFDNTKSSGVSTFDTALSGGLGEFAGDVPSAAELTTSWNTWLTIMSKDTAIVGNSIGQVSIDFAKTDHAGASDQDYQL